MNHSFKIALCGIMTSLSLTFMFIASLFPIAVYLCTILSGFCIALSVEEVGLRYAVDVYVASSILSVMLIPDKETSFVFIFIFGFYPIYKYCLNRYTNSRLSNKLIQTALKILFINVSCITFFLITVYLIGVPKESYMIGNVYLPGAFLVVSNFICLQYDKILDIFINVCKIKLKKFIIRKW